jgi:TrpR-related protein YerC/YecD
MNIRNENIDKVFEAILSLKTVDECYRFFEDICTIKEIQDISQRYEVARLLTAKKNYNEITKATGASSTTITRVNKCLMYGNDGYKMVIDRTENK